LKKQEETKVNDQADTTANLSPHCILIVEDEEPSRMYYTAILGNENTSILEASNGAEAVKAVKNHPEIDMVLMDIKMPEMDGYEATRQIRQFNNDIVIIAQTAFALSGDRENAIAAGCNDYISKPIRKAELMEVMYKYFGKQEIL